MFLPPDRVLYEFAALIAKSRLATAVRIGAAGRRLSLESLQRSPLFPLNHQHTPPPPPFFLLPEWTTTLSSLPLVNDLSSMAVSIVFREL